MKSILLALTVFIHVYILGQTANNKLNIEEQHRVEIGGVEQSLLFRGRAQDNPVLLILHGGFGPSMIYAHYRDSSELESYFTVVEWDQRGCGKSFSNKIKKESMTIDLLVSDLNEVVEYTCRKLDKKKIFILAESWGSIIGIKYVSEHPERVTAYISSPQVIDVQKNNKILLEKLIALAKEKQDNNTLKKLDHLALPTHTSEEKEINKFSKTTEKALMKLDDSYGFKKLKKIFMEAVKTSPYYNFNDRMNTYRSMAFFGKATMPYALSANIPEQIPELKVPSLFLVGRLDIGTELIENYVSQLKAPEKELIWFDASGHIPRAEESEKFEKVLIDFYKKIQN